MPSEKPVVVVGYDGHKQAAGTLRFAADFATKLGARLQVVHVVDLDDYPVDPDSAFWDEQEIDAVDEEKAAAASTLADWPGEWSYRVERGEPVEALTRAAVDVSAQLIVVGAREGGFIRQLLSGRGPVMSELSDEGFPVLVAPATPHQAKGRH